MKSSALIILAIAGFFLLKNVRVTGGGVGGVPPETDIFKMQAAEPSPFETIPIDKAQTTALLMGGEQAALAALPAWVDKERVAAAAGVSLPGVFYPEPEISPMGGQTSLAEAQARSEQMALAQAEAVEERKRQTTALLMGSGQPARARSSASPTGAIPTQPKPVAEPIEKEKVTSLLTGGVEAAIAALPSWVDISRLG